MQYNFAIFFSELTKHANCKKLMFTMKICSEEYKISCLTWDSPIMLLTMVSTIFYSAPKADKVADTIQH